MLADEHLSSPLCVFSNHSVCSNTKKKMYPSNTELPSCFVGEQNIKKVCE